MASFNILLRSQVSLHPSGDPSEFFSSYDGVITCMDDESGVIKKVGLVRALRIHARLACNAGQSLFDVCDSHSGELLYLHNLLYEPGGYSFKEKWMDQFDATDSDLLLIDYVILAPRWRKLNLGLLAVRKMVDLIGSGSGLVVSGIAPLQSLAYKQLRIPASWFPHHGSRKERKAAVVRLRRYFRRMGFQRLGRTPYYAMSLTQILPTAAELLGPEFPQNEAH